MLTLIELDINHQNIDAIGGLVHQSEIEVKIDWAANDLYIYTDSHEEPLLLALLGELVLIGARPKLMN